jgi:ABC-type dipeptide/oligopeptide/nickel transport system permease subunit
MMKQRMNEKSNADAELKKKIRQQKRQLRLDSGRKFWRRFCKNKAAVFGLVVFLLILLVAIFAPLVAPYSAHNNSFPVKTAPNAINLCGTDELGRDVLSRTIYGARVSLIVGVAAALLSTLIGVIIGCVAGYTNKFASTALLKVTEAFQMLPMFFVGILLSSIFGPSLLLIVLVIGLMGWPSCARIVRGNFSACANVNSLPPPARLAAENSPLCFARSCRASFRRSSSTLPCAWLRNHDGSDAELLWLRRSRAG